MTIAKLLIDENNTIEKLSEWVANEGVESVAYALSTIDKFWGKISQKEICEEIVQLLNLGVDNVDNYCIIDRVRS